MTHTIWTLRSLDPAPKTLRITPGSAHTIGRDARADFVIDAALLSRLHCRLSASATELSVEDLNSTNGTYVNDLRVDRSPLRNGDRLRLGRVELTVSRGT